MFKFLDPTGATYYDRDGDGEAEPFYYILPRPDQKWSDWTEHPDPAEPDGKACGPGRLHLMLRLDARYVPPNWWPWWAQKRNRIGGDNEKISTDAVRLRRITPRVLARCLRLGWGKEAYLPRANLPRANLTRANLSGADLSWADLCWANLSRADLCWADLSRADLCWANLSRADLSWADLSGANLSGADLSWADLSGANLSWANLSGVYYNKCTVWPADFSPPTWAA